MKLSYFLILALLNSSLSSAQTTKCDLRDTNFGSVCVCTPAYCDYLVDQKPAGARDFILISTTKSGLRFETTNGQFGGKQKFIVLDHSRSTSKKSHNLAERNETDFENAALMIENGRAFLQFSGVSTGGGFTSAARQSLRSIHVNINRAKEHQKIVGFGGALTGSVSHILQNLPQSLQDHIYKSYYHRDGIAYNMLRMPIAGCDFDLEPWAYNEYPRNDRTLSNFTRLDARDELKIQQIQRLKQVAGLEHIKLMAAAWSSPTWMKSNNDWTGYSYLLPQYYQTWADYHLKFLELMDAKQMPLWAISTGNEPLNGVIGWFFVRFMSLGWTPRNQAIWLSENLGPTLKNSKYKNVLIFGNDDQRYTYPAWFNTMRLSRTNSLDYLDGLAVHWYWDNVFAPTLIDEAHRAMPEKLLLNTESSIGDKPWETHGPELGSWERAEQYTRALLQNLKHDFNGWIDWNLVLDEQGGPNYVKNHVDAAVIVNTTTGLEFYKQPIFYALGHFSKFMAEGSVRIETQVLNFNLDAVGFKRPDGSMALVLFNSDRVPVDVVLNDSVRGNIVINIPPRSLHTMVYN